MAKDITIRVTGQNPDGTMTVQQVDGGNPFAMTTPAAGGGTVTGGFPVNLGGSTVVYATEGDAKLAEAWFRDQLQGRKQAAPMFGGLGSNGGSWLRTGADAAGAMSSYLQRRNINRKLEDLADALADSNDASQALNSLEATGKYTDLIPVLRALFRAERDATETSIAVLEDGVTALDIQTGAGVARVAADLMGKSAESGFGGAEGSGLAYGAAGLGLGVLLANKDNTTVTDRRRRRR